MAVWMYRLGADGEVEARLFETESDAPKGWVDSPAKATRLTRGKAG